MVSLMCTVGTLTGSRVCSPLFLGGKHTTHASLKAELTGSCGAAPPLTMTTIASTPSVLRGTVSDALIKHSNF